MNGAIQLFPTIIYRDPATTENYNSVQEEIKNCLFKIKEKKDYSEVSWIYDESKKFLEKSRSEGVKYNYLLKDDLIGKYNLINLKKRIFESVEKYIKSTKWARIYDNQNIDENSPQEYEIKLKSSWMNIQSKGKSHEWHCHPGYIISGVYYMRVSADLGGIQFQNPNPIMQWCHFPEGSKSPQSLTLIPKDGDIILFPAWLTHNTIENIMDEDRISVSFNIDLEIVNDHNKNTNFMYK